MRHLNFSIDPEGTIRSLDGFNQGMTLTKALIGDSSATLKFPETQWMFSGYANFTVPGLPIMDKELKTAIDLVANRCDRVFLFPSTEMHGAIKFDEISEKKALPWSERFQQFQPDDRYCVGNLHYVQVNSQTMDILLENYLEIINGIIEKYENFYLVPVVNRLLGSKIPYSFRAYPELKKLDRCINLDWLDPNQADLWSDSHGHLSRLGWSLMKERLEIV